MVASYKFVYFLYSNKFVDYEAIKRRYINCTDCIASYEVIMNDGLGTYSDGHSKLLKIKPCVCLENLRKNRKSSSQDKQFRTALLGFIVRNGLYTASKDFGCIAS